MNIIELFSGIGGFTLGLQQAGFTIDKHYFSEIDKHAIANYKYNFKNAKSIGSVTDVRGTEFKNIDIITFGSPCQDFSLAGKRKGMEGQRSSLILEAIRLISEIKPSVFIWENVKGTFSSNNGADFWAIINAFANIGGYRLEWQLLNTSWFLPQNRERIYLIGHLTKKSKLGVFPITENGGLFNQENKSNKRLSQTKHSTCLKSSGVMKADDTFIQVPKKACTLTAGGNSGGLHSDMTIIKVQPVLTPDRKEKRQNGRRFKNDGEPAFTCNCQDTHGVMISTVKMKRTKEGKELRKDYELGKIKHGYNEHRVAVPVDNKNLGTLDSSEKSRQIFTGTRIRRLTEIETERLQGFPDDWTKYGIYDGEIKQISKTQRYKLTGNAVTTKVVQAIAERLSLSKA